MMKKLYFPTVALFVISAFAATAFAQLDVARRTTAITYPLDEVVMVNFRGTTRFPRMKGEARIKRTKRNGTEIELSVSKMPRPFELGAGYATYVLWAISPDGRADNLGEIKRRGFFEFDSKISVTTPLQTFALIITAEPHFLVRRPSQQVMLENLNPYSTSGKTIGTVSTAQYFGNSSDYFRDSRTPEIAEVDYSKTPSTILQARQAVALAKFAGADRDATQELAEATTLLSNAEAGWRAGRREEDVDITARRAISAAVKAEETAGERGQAREQRNEKSRSDAEIRQAERKYTDAQAEIAELKAELEREMRNRELSERDVQNSSNLVRDLRDENAKLREELTRTKIEAENAKRQLAAIQSEKTKLEEQRADDQRLAQIKAAEPALIQVLRSFGTVSQTQRGIEVTLPENYWANSRSTDFSVRGNQKLEALAALLADNAGYDIAIESHTDNSGNPDAIQAVTDGRARAVSSRFSSAGVADARLSAKGLGASLPIAPNTTVKNRAKNRRVLVVLTVRR
ncbi:MAG: OmpA family protein [Acidobacteria bacterium]|nr:OmpA family protein [Acidobacteriota bacterium]